MSGEAARQLSVCYREETRYFFGVSSETEKRTGFACPFSFLFSSGGSVKKAHQERVSFRSVRPSILFPPSERASPQQKLPLKLCTLPTESSFLDAPGDGGHSPEHTSLPTRHRPIRKSWEGWGRFGVGGEPFFRKVPRPLQAFFSPRPTTSPPAQCRRRRCGRGWIRSSPLPRGTRRFADARQGGWPRCGPRPPQRWGGKRHLPSRISHLPA